MKGKFVKTDLNVGDGGEETLKHRMKSVSLIIQLVNG